MQARAVVVGGGVMGVSIAMHLAQRLDPLSEPVVLLEKKQLGAGSSGRSGAILRQLYSSRELAGMARDSLKVYAGFLSSSGRSIGFQRSGVLSLAVPDRPDDVELVERNIEMMTEIGIDVRRLDDAEIRALVPGIEVRAGTIAAFEPGAGVVDARLTVEGFAALAKMRGVTTRIGHCVTDIRVESGRVTGVETESGPIDASQVVVAAGPWSGPLLARAGVDLPLRVVRPEQHFVATPEAHSEAPSDAELLDEALIEDELDERFGPSHEEQASVAHPVLLDFERNSYARCESAEGRTRIGTMDSSRDLELSDPDALDEEVGAPFQAWARDVLQRRMPVYADLPDRGSLAGLYTMTPDSQAVIGEMPGVEGLFVVTGFSGHGFKLAPSIGEGVAQMMYDEPVSAFDPAFFSPSRFAAETVDKGRGFGL